MKTFIACVVGALLLVGACGGDEAEEPIVAEGEQTDTAGGETAPVGMGQGGAETYPAAPSE